MNMLGSLPRRQTLARSTALLLSATILGALVFAWTPASSAARKTPPRGPSYMTGISDSQDEMFANPLWQQLHTQISRLVIPWDVAVRSYDLDQAEVWIHDAEARHQKILVAFYHSEYTKTKL